MPADRGRARRPARRAPGRRCSRVGAQPARHRRPGPRRQRRLPGHARAGTASTLAPYLARGHRRAAASSANDADVLAQLRAARPRGAPTARPAGASRPRPASGSASSPTGRVVTGHRRRGRRDRPHQAPRGRGPGLPLRATPGAWRPWPAAGRWSARLGEPAPPSSTSATSSPLALAGDAEAARGLLRESGRRLGEVLAVAINLLNPQAVVVGGDMAAAFDVYAARHPRESIYAHASALATRDLQFLPADLRRPRRPGRLRGAGPRRRPQSLGGRPAAGAHLRQGTVRATTVPLA